MTESQCDAVEKAQQPNVTAIHICIETQFINDKGEQDLMMQTFSVVPESFRGSMDRPIEKRRDVFGKVIDLIPLNDFFTFTLSGRVLVEK